MARCEGRDGTCAVRAGGKEELGRVVVGRLHRVREVLGVERGSVVGQGTRDRGAVDVLTVRRAAVSRVLLGQDAVDQRPAFGRCQMHEGEEIHLIGRECRPIRLPQRLVEGEDGKELVTASAVHDFGELPGRRIDLLKHARRNRDHLHGRATGRRREKRSARPVHGDDRGRHLLGVAERSLEVLGPGDVAARIGRSRLAGVREGVESDLCPGEDLVGERRSGRGRAQVRWGPLVEEGLQAIGPLDATAPVGAEAGGAAHDPSRRGQGLSLGRRARADHHRAGGDGVQVVLFEHVQKVGEVDGARRRRQDGDLEDARDREGGKLTEPTHDRSPDGMPAVGDRGSGSAPTALQSSARS